jgi:aspartyl-tRNA(Asn)/glutamyl-tRNA(Gln) amidotransferase subunit A
MTIGEAAARLRAREVSALELAQDSLRRIREEQPRLNAFITVTEELALERARRADEELARGLDRGPLHGIPYALKDVFDMRGIPTTCGSKIFSDRIAEHDCAVYEKLNEAGAVPMGKTGLHELAYGITNDNPHFGAVRNPHDTERIAGGSSGGSGAAVAGGMVFFALGTDTGGSTRIPAAYCGCTGLKPTMGRVSRYGMMPLGFSLDHAGVLSRDARDAALVLNAIAGFDRRDDRKAWVRGWSLSRPPIPRRSMWSGG